MLDGLFAFDNPCTGIQAVLPEEIVVSSLFSYGCVTFPP